MKSTIVYEDGSVRCPKCGASVLGAATKRTGKAKLVGVVTVGVGVVAMPKRLKCSGCGENLKRGDGKPQPVPGAEKAPTPAPAVPAWLERVASRGPSQQEMLYARMDREEAAKAAGAVPPEPVKKRPKTIAEARAEFAAVREAGREQREQQKAERADRKQDKATTKAEKQAAKDAAKAQKQPTPPPPPPGMHWDEQAQRWARWNAETRKWEWAEPAPTEGAQ